MAFYDALETNDSAVQVLGDETLRGIARELVETVRKNVTIDWTLRENVRAQLRVLVKRILRKHGYPPDKQEKATQSVLEQAAPALYSWVRHRLVLIEGEQGGEHDGHDGTGRWPGGARPSRWRRRASACAAPADVGEAQESAVLRLLRGEDLELVSRELGVMAAELTAWRDAFLAAGEASLKARPADGHDLEIGRLKAKVGDLTMTTELLEAKIERLEGRRPLARRRPRP